MHSLSHLSYWAGTTESFNLGSRLGTSDYLLLFNLAVQTGVVRYRIIVLKARGRGTYSLSKGSPAETTTGLLELMKMSTYLSHRWKNNHAARAPALPRGGAFCARWLFTRSCKNYLALVFPLSAQTNRSITAFELGMILITICFTTNHDAVTEINYYHHLLIL